MSVVKKLRGISCNQDLMNLLSPQFCHLAPVFTSWCWVAAHDNLRQCFSNSVENSDSGTLLTGSDLYGRDWESVFNSHSRRFLFSGKLEEIKLWPKVLSDAVIERSYFYRNHNKLSAQSHLVTSHLNSQGLVAQTTAFSACILVTKKTALMKTVNKLDVQFFKAPFVHDGN